MSAAKTALDFGSLTMDSILGGISIAGLASLNDPKHEAMKPVKVKCHGRPDPKQPPASGIRIPCPHDEEFTVPLFFQTLSACDRCRAESDKANKLDAAKTYWEAICPPSYRDTDKTHAGFPKLQYEATRAFKGTESLLFYGPTRGGKTRLGMLLLKRCLVSCNLHIGVLWPEQLKAVKGARDGLERIQQWGRYDVLLMDDALLTGATDDTITGWLKDLIDYRMRYNRHCIITSQVGSEDYKEQQGKWGEVSKSDKERVEALLARVRETCRVISFAKQETKQDEQEF